MALTLAAGCIREESPVAIFPVASPTLGTICYRPFPLPGCWWRVYPRTARDIFFLQYLDIHKNMFAPAEGGGVLIKCCPPGWTPP